MIEFAAIVLIVGCAVSLVLSLLGGEVIPEWVVFCLALVAGVAWARHVTRGRSA